MLSLLRRRRLEMRGGRVSVCGDEHFARLRDGQIEAEGTHDELLDTCAYYAQLVGASQGEFLQQEPLAQVA